MRLINAVTTAEAISKAHGIPLDELVDTFANVPTIDAVPVVRCGECKFRNTSWYDKRDMLESFCRWDRDESPNDDDYCSYGERRK